MTKRYGALTLQLKNLSDLSNIGGTYTDIFSASGSQTMSGVDGTASFTFSARSATLYAAVTSNVGQVAYVYITDQVAGGAAMDVATFIIDDIDTSTSDDGAMVTVSGPGLADQLTYVTAGDSAIDNGAGGESSTDLDDIMAFAPAGWSYTATGTGSSTRSSTGSYHASRGDNVMELLIATTRRSGDIFRLSSYSPPAKTIVWRASPDSSGVTLRMPQKPTDYEGSTTTGIIYSLTEKINVGERLTGIRPYAAGIGGGRIDITGIDSGDTGGDPTGYTTTFASNLIVNTTLETSLGYQKRLDVDLSAWQANDATNATQLTTVAVQLWNAAINYLADRDSSKKYYSVVCNVAADLRPGQTVTLDYDEYEGGTSGGTNVINISGSYTIQDVENSVGSDGIRMTTLTISDTVAKRPTAARAVANAIDTARKTTRKSDQQTAPGAVSTSRTLNATQPVRIDGTSAGDLSSDRTLSINGLSSVGSANQIPGANSAGAAWEYKTLTNGTGINITHGAGTVTVTNTGQTTSLASVPFVTIGNTASLSGERALTAGDGLDLTDGGANSTATLTVDVTDIIGNGLTETSNNIILGTPSTLTVSTTNSVGASTHSHAITTSNAVLSATASILATDSNGRFSTQGYGAGGEIAENGSIFIANRLLLNETGDTNVTRGLVLNQGAADDAIISLKSSDVATGMTAVAETDTFGRLGKSGNGDGTTGFGAGGLQVLGLRDADGDANRALVLSGYLGEAADTSTTIGASGSNGVVQITGAVKSAADVTGVATTGNLLSVSNSGTTNLLIKGNGDTYQRGEWVATDDDVAHGMTDFVITSGYARVSPFSSTDGGAVLAGFSEDVQGLGLFGFAGNSTTGKATSSSAAIEIRATLKSGTGAGLLGANANLLVVRNNSTTRWIVDAEGDTHRDGTDNTYDVYHDAQLARAFDRAVSPGSVIDSDFDAMLQYGRDDLIAAGILHESGFYNESRLLRLAIGAVWQGYEREQKLTQRIETLERRLLN